MISESFEDILVILCRGPTFLQWVQCMPALAPICGIHLSCTEGATGTEQRQEGSAASALVLVVLDREVAPELFRVRGQQVCFLAQPPCSDMCLPGREWLSWSSWSLGLSLWKGVLPSSALRAGAKLQCLF